MIRKWRVRRRLWQRGVQQLRTALRPQVHDDKAVLAAWDAADDTQHELGFQRLEHMLQRSNCWPL